MAVSARARLAFLLLPTLVILSSFGAGWWVAVWPLRKRAAKRARVTTLGAALELAGGGPDDRAAAAQAYLDPASAARELDRYCFAVPTVPAPFVGAIPAPGEHGSARIDAFGLRGAHALSLPKPAGALRVVLLGGSTAFGSGAPDQARTPAGYLEAALVRALPGRAVEVFACACPSWTSTHERIAVENRVRRWEPDLVLALSGVNDAHWGWLRRDPLWLRTYEEDHPFRLLDAALSRAGLGGLEDVVPVGPAPFPPEEVAAAFADNARLSAAALALREGATVPYLLCLQPDLAASAKPLTAREARFVAGKEPAEVAYHREVVRLTRARLAEAAARGLRWADLHPAIDARPAGEELFLDTCHFGDRGNQLLGERLAALALPLLEGR